MAGGGITPHAVRRGCSRSRRSYADSRINEAPEMTRLLDLGVDGIVTDFPGRLVELLSKRAAE